MTQVADPDIRRTLLFLVRDGQILLAMKKRGFGAGRWNGVGGKIEPGESIEDALVRECQEEIGVTPKSWRKVAELNFLQDIKSDPWHMYVHAYISDDWVGEPSESEEMRPQWFALDDIPYAGMWDDDKYWLQDVLEGKCVYGEFTFDEHDAMKSHDVREVTDFTSIAPTQ